jgi:hypothetical protein
LAITLGKEFILFFSLINVLLGEIHYTGGIQSDNSDQTYIVHYLYCPHRLSL